MGLKRNNVVSKTGVITTPVQLNMTGLSTLSLTNGDYHILNWLSVLLENRRFRIDGAIAQQAKAYIFETPFSE